MRKTILFAAFVGAGAGFAGVSAAPEVMKGSDTLFDITTEVVKTCADKVAGANVPLNINYIGGGSGGGETATVSINPAVARAVPMSRFLQGGSTSSGTVCSPADPAGSKTKAEGVMFALDGIGIWGSKSSSGSATCNGAAVDCNPATDTTAGLAFNRTITITLNEIVPGPNGTLETDLTGDDVYYGYAANNTSKLGQERVLPGPDGVINSTPAGDDRLINTTVKFTYTSWKDVLAIVWAGSSGHWLENNADTAPNGIKDCDSNLRHAIVENYGSMFQVDCTTGNCTQLDHAWRRDDVSGTTDTFINLVGLTGITPFKDPATGNFNATSYFSPFCNSFSQPAKGQHGPLIDWRPDSAIPVASGGTCAAGCDPLDIGQYDFDQQDADPIRRKCADDEKNCSRNGTLGVVLPILPTDNMAATQAFPMTQSDKDGVGTFQFVNPPRIIGLVSGGTYRARCANGDTHKGLCLIPRNVALATSNILNHPVNKPSGIIKNVYAGYRCSQADARVYNNTARTTAGSLVADTRGRDAVGFWRMLEVSGSYTRTDPSINIPNGGRLTEPLAALCQNEDATSQIGCLASQHACSLGYSGLGAVNGDPAHIADPNAFSIAGVKVNLIDPDKSCIRPFTYPIARRLFVDTVFGFENVYSAANPSSLDATQTDELAMVQCFSKQAFIDPIVNKFDFVTLGPDSAPVAPKCVDFNEAATLANKGCGDTSNVNACSNNGAIALEAKVSTNGASVPSNTDCVCTSAVCGCVP